MDAGTQVKIKAIVDRKKGDIKKIIDECLGAVVGSAQAVDGLRKALDKVEQCINRHEFDKASALGYRDVSSEFIFLQRVLGSINDIGTARHKLIQDIAIEVGGVAYEDVEPFVLAQWQNLIQVMKNS